MLYSKMSESQKEELLFDTLIENAKLRRELETTELARDHWFNEAQRLKMQRLKAQQAPTESEVNNEHNCSAE